VFFFSFRSSILEEVQNQGNTKLSTNKNVVVLGDNESGKTTLVAKLQGVEDPKKGSGLEYAYIDVRDEYRDGNIIIESISIEILTMSKNFRSHQTERLGSGRRSGTRESIKVRPQRKDIPSHSRDSNGGHDDSVGPIRSIAELGIHFRRPFR
jgi:energy-coupling factor transporter ATP-binding protein EcfA2